MTAGRAEGKESKSLPENPFLQKVVFRTFPQKLLNCLYGLQHLCLSSISGSGLNIALDLTASNNKSFGGRGSGPLGVGPTCAGDALPLINAAHTWASLSPCAEHFLQKRPSPNLFLPFFPSSLLPFTVSGVPRLLVFQEFLFSLDSCL
jgi:hypothetical protein